MAFINKNSSTTSPTASAILFISFGGPERPEDIMPFLEIVTQGRGIPRARLEEVAHHYEDIGGKSPINDITRGQAAALEHEVKRPVYIGQRNWHPFLEDTLRKMASDGVQRATGFITAAHRCEASLERYIQATEAARAKVSHAPVIDYVQPWFDHPLFIDAIVARIREMSPPQDAVWVFTAHSIPVPMAEGSPYVQDLQATARLVAEKLAQPSWQLAYSSRSGRPQDPWLEPDVCDVIRSEASKGKKNLFFIPIGFVADHVEVLYDLDVEAQAAAKEAGVTLLRAKTVGDHPLFVRMMADVIRKCDG